MIELLTGIEGESCKTALLAGSEGRSYTMKWRQCDTWSGAAG